MNNKWKEVESSEGSWATERDQDLSIVRTSDPMIKGGKKFERTGLFSFLETRSYVHCTLVSFPH
jgi:hypothetical protein